MQIIEVLRDIYSSTFPKEIVERTLNKSLYGDDFINSKTFISIKVRLETDDDYKALLYRRLWECVYLKSGDYSWIADHEEYDNIAIIRLSIAEVIGVIEQMTPPVLKNKLGEFTSSIDHIYTVLNDFLFDEKAGEYYRSVFTKAINLNEFPYVSNYDFSRTKNLMNLTGHNEICDVIASTMSLRDICELDGAIDSKRMCSITFVITTKDIRQLCHELVNSHHVTSVDCNAYGISVRIVAPNFKPKLEIDRWFVNKIKNTYSKLLEQ